jgi:hypothetical protein
VLGQLYKKSRGVTAESTKFGDRKGNEAYVGATSHPLLVLVKLGLLSAALSGFGRRGAGNAEQTTASRANFEYGVAESYLPGNADFSEFKATWHCL